MASNLFAQVTQRMLQTKDLDVLVKGSKNLPEGDHEVTITAVDTENIGKNRVKVTFQDDEGNSHNEFVNLLNRDGNEWGFSFRLLLSALFADKDAITQFVEMVGAESEEIACITGMKVRIKLERGDGVIIKSDANGLYAGYEYDASAKTTGSKVTDDYEEAKQAREAVKAANLKASYMNVKRYIPISTENNCKALAAAYTNFKSRPAGVTAIKNTFSAGI
jgi:hypothetical protein